MENVKQSGPLKAGCGLGGSRAALSHLSREAVKGFTTSGHHHLPFIPALERRWEWASPLDVLTEPYLSSELLHFSWLGLSGPMQLSQPKNSGTKQLHSLSWITLLEKWRYAFLKSYDPRGKEMMLLMRFTLKPFKVF